MTSKAFVVMVFSCHKIQLIWSQWYTLLLCLWCTLDVPDPPVNVTLSDLRDRSVKLHWMPTKDHNSHITGNVHVDCLFAWVQIYKDTPLQAALRCIQTILCHEWLLNALNYWAEYLIEFEENHWEPGKWRPLLRVSGHKNSAPLSLYGHINYQFRVSAVNAIGRGHPSKPSERYKTPPAGNKIPYHYLTSVYFMFLYFLVPWTMEYHAFDIVLQTPKADLTIIYVLYILFSQDTYY